MKNFFTAVKWRRFGVAITLSSLLMTGFGAIPRVSADVISSHDVSVDMMAFDLSGVYQLVEGQPTGAGAFDEGNVKDYPEGTCIPFLIEAKNTSHGTGDISISSSFDYSDGSDLGILSFSQVTTTLTNPETADNLNDLTFLGMDLSSGATSFKTDNGGWVSAIITGAFSGSDGTGAPGPNDLRRHYNILLQSVPKNRTVYVLFCAQLDVNASAFSHGNDHEHEHGADMSVRVGSSEHGGEGARNIAIKADELLPALPLPPKLTVTKVVVNDNGGSASTTVSSFPLFVGNTSVVSGEQNTFPAGTYTVSETGPAGYTAIFSPDCAGGQITLVDGDVKTCTITNDDKPATLTVIKHVISDDGSQSVAGNFTLNVSGVGASTSSFSGSEAGTVVTLNAGAYSVDENPALGFIETTSTDCVGVMNIGDVKTCTITNNDIPWQATTGTLIVKKTVVGGLKAPEDFTFTVKGVNPSPSSFAGSSTGTEVSLGYGNYSVTESPDPQYDASFSNECSGAMATGTVVICSVTNTFANTSGGGTGTLTVIKQVVNIGGGTLQAGDFTMVVIANGVTSTFPGSATGTDVILNAEDVYTVTEMENEPYVVSKVGDCSGVMAANAHRTCTITNTYPNTGGGGGTQPKTGTLIVIKNVVNQYSGSTNQPSDFTMTVTGGSPSLSSFPGSPTGTTVTINVGSYYSVSESGPGGYTPGLSADCSGAIAENETKTCTVTNTKQPQEGETSADLKLDKTGDSASLPTGTILDYLLTLTNIGPDPATNAQVSDVLPSGFEYQSSIASQGSYNPATGVWTVGAMAVNDVVTLHIIVKVTAAPGEYTNTGVASALEFDPNHTNNTEMHTVTVTVNNGGGGGTTIPTTGGSGGGGGGGTTIPTPTTNGGNVTNGGGAPTPAVLGVTDVATSTVADPVAPVAPEPRVLGATDELPRTGLPIWMMLAAAVAAGVAVRRVK